MMKLFFKADAARPAQTPRQQLEALEHQLMLKRYAAMKLLPRNADWAKRQVTRAMSEARDLSKKIAEISAVIATMDERLAA